jgi:hypothetical protein
MPPRHVQDDFISQIWRDESATPPPRTQPIYVLWRESANSELVVAKGITEFAYRSVGARRTQPFANSQERRLAGRALARKNRERTESAVIALPASNDRSGKKKPRPMLGS